MNTVKSRLVMGFVLTVAFGLAGCGGPPGPATGTVSGTVTLDGDPLEDASIAFKPKDGVGPSSGAQVVDGKYTTAVPLGEMRVEISASKEVGTVKAYNTPDSPTRPIFKDLIPKIYNIDSTLSVTVKAGENEGNFELSSKPK
jgi:hypothetical protein